MRKFVPIIILSLLFSCENEIRVNMDDHAMPVTYCILDIDDSVQFVRLAKSFLPEAGLTETGPLALDKWDEPVDIYIEEWAGAANPNIYNFRKSDTIRQDTGYFARPSFSLYQSDFKPVPGVLYYLYLWFPDRNYYSFASTVTVDGADIINPVAIPGRKLTFSETDDFIVEFKTPRNSGYHQFSFVFAVEEYVGGNINPDRFDFGGEAFGDNSGEILVSQLNSSRFYETLLKRYVSIGDGDYRRITGTEFVLNSFGQELRLYNQLYDNGSQPWEIQSYSSFRNGFGLFSSRSRSRVTNLELSDLTYQILTGDPLYTHLKFIK